MARLLIALMILILGVSGDGRIVNKRDVMITNDWNQFVSWLCQNDLASIWGIICGSSTTSAPISTTTMASSTSKPAASSTSTASNNNMDTTSSPTTLERAHWCQFSNGTYISYGYTFMYSACTLCQCGQSHAISCTTLQCMPTYCIDGSTPSPKPGQCCPQCAYENKSTPCVVSSVNFPQGTLLRQTSDNVQCWCQLGDIECRKATVSLFSSMDLFGDGTAVYVIVIIVCAVILLGTLLCCGCTVFFYYYYYQRQQQAAQDLTEYYVNAGWQPMSEDGQVIEDTSEQKQAEAEQAQYEFENPTGNSEEYIPPPYALYNGSFINEQSEKDQKHM